MLAVTRKKGERIHINDDIVIHVIETKAKTVKIGIEAPASHLIFRGEIYDKIAESNQEMVAANFDDTDVMAFLKNKSNTSNEEPK